MLDKTPKRTDSMWRENCNIHLVDQNGQVSLACNMVGLKQERQIEMRDAKHGRRVPCRELSSVSFTSRRLAAELARVERQPPLSLARTFKCNKKRWKGPPSAL